MNTKYPYEEKIIKEAMSLIDRNKVVEYCDVKGDILENYLVVYSGTSKKFCGICASRFLRNNFDSAIVIEDASDITYYLKRLNRKRLIRCGERGLNHLQLFNYDQYLKDYGDDGFDMLVNYDKDGSDLIKKIAYAVTYMKYPAIKDVVEKGYYTLAEQLSFDNYAASDLLSGNVEEIRIDEQCRKYLNDNNAAIKWWFNLHRLNKIDNVTFDQLTYMYDNSIEIEDVYSLIVDFDCYSVKSLIEYINRCVMYQGYEPRKVISDLYLYNYNGKIVLKKLDQYPNDLAKMTRFIKTTREKFDCVASREYINKYHYNYSSRNRYCFKDDNYYIKAENDIGNVAQVSKIFNYYDITQYTKKTTEYYWLCDAKTDRKIALLKIDRTSSTKQSTRATTKINNQPLSYKEARFLKKWFEYRKNIDLSLIKPQYSMV